MLVLRSFAVLAALAAIILSGASSAHLVPGNRVHLDFEFSAYAAGEPLTILILVSNPTDENASFAWTNSCMMMGSVESESRVLGGWNPYGPCLMYVPGGLNVPANSSVLWNTLTFDTRTDDGCIQILLGMSGYPVSGSAKTCPGSPPAPLGRMVLALSAPASATGGARFDFRTTIRTQGGYAVEGILVSAHLGVTSVGTALTGPEGVAHFSGLAPSVTVTTLTSLVVQASGAGWHSASRTANVVVLPTMAKSLLLEASPSTGDVIGSDGLDMLEFVVRGNDGLPAENLSVAVAVEAPLRVEELRELGGGRYQLTIRASVVNESSVATVRVVANAPGFAGGEVRLDYVVLAARTPPTEGDARPSNRESPAPLLAVVFVVGAMVCVAALVLLRAHRRRGFP